MSREIHLFTAIDSTWLDYALMFIASVKQTTTAPVHYTILYAGPADPQALQAWGRARDIHLNAIDFDAAAERLGLADKLDLRCPIAWLSACAYWGRYCAEFLYDELPERLAYADVDMVAVGDLAPLMDVELGEAAVGAVRYPNDKAVQRVGIPRGRYVNNGMLLFDTRRFDGRQCIDDMQAALATGKPVFSGQCAFNMAMQGNIALLDKMWNVQGEWREEVGQRARLVHFTGPVKPWNTLSVDPMRWQVRDLLHDIDRARAWRPDRSPRKLLRLAARNTRAVWRRA